MNSSKQSPLGGLLRLGFPRFAASLLGLLITTLIARNLSVEELGIFSMVVGSCAFVTIAGECGMKSVAMSEGSRRGGTPAVLRPYLRARLKLSLALTLLGLACGALFYGEHLAVIVPVLASALVMSLQADWILLMNREYDWAGWAVSSRALFYFAMIVALKYTVELSPVGLGIAFTLSWALAALLSWVAVWRKKIQLQPESTTKPISQRALLSLGWPVLGGALITQLMLGADLLWIGATTGKASAGVYYLANAIITAGLILANALNQIAFSRYGPLKGKPEAFLARLKPDLLLVTGVASVLALGTIFVLPELIPRVFGSRHQASAQLVAFLAPYLVAYHVYALCSACCVCLGIQRQVLRGLSSMLVVIPVTLAIASASDNLAAFAYAKCFLMIYATAVLLLVTPAEFRSNTWKYFAAPLALILLILLALAPQFELYDIGT